MRCHPEEANQFACASNPTIPCVGDKCMAWQTVYVQSPAPADEQPSGFRTVSRMTPRAHEPHPEGLGYCGMVKR